MNDEHVLALVETVDRAYLDAVHVFALDAIFSDDVSHERSLRVCSKANEWRYAAALAVVAVADKRRVVLAEI
jgi:hypothetical protein